MLVNRNIDVNKLNIGMQTVAVTASFISSLVKEIAGNDISTTINDRSLSDVLIYSMVYNKLNKKLTSK